jgi:hypothetical protein
VFMDTGSGATQPCKVCYNQRCLNPNTVPPGPYERMSLNVHPKIPCNTAHDVSPTKGKCTSYGVCMLASRNSSNSIVLGQANTRNNMCNLNNMHTLCTPHAHPMHTPCTATAKRHTLIKGRSIRLFPTDDQNMGGENCQQRACRPPHTATCKGRFT